MKYKLQDLIDMEHFQNLQDRLNEIYSFPSSIIDNDGNILTATAWQDICTQFHRKNKDSEKICIKSDQYINDHIHEANPAVSYRCPHGLVDNAMPIIIDGFHYGNFFTGQFFLEEPDMEFFRAQAKKYGFDEDAYLEAVKRVPIWTQKQLDNYLFFIKGLIAVISESGLKKLKEMESLKKIEASVERNRSILKSAMDGYWLTDTEGRLLEVNDAYCRMSGYSEDELLSMRIPDLEVVENPQLVAEHMQKVIFQGSDRFESKHRRKDGAVFEVEVSIQFRPEEGGQCVCFLRDITDRRQAERQYQMLFQEMLDGFALHEIICNAAGQPVDYRFLAVNPAFEKMTGLKADQVLNRTVLDVLSSTERHWIEIYGKVALSGEPAFFENYAAAIGKHFQVTAFRPAPNQFACIFADITERKNAEEALKESKLFLDNMSDIAYRADEKGNLVWMNSAGERVTGFSRDDLIGKPFLPLFIEADHPSLIDVYKRTLMGESLENTLTFKSGVSCHFTSLPHRNANGDIVGTFGVARDITAQLDAQRALQASEARLKKAQETAKIGNWEYDITTGKVWGSEETFRIYGIERTSEFLPLDKVESYILDAKRVNQALVDLIAKNKVYDIEFQIDSKAREGLTLIRSMADLVCDAEGNPVKVHGVIQDITDFRRVEEERRQSEKDLRESQRIAHLGSWRLDMTTNQVVWSDELYNMYGFDPTLPPPPYTEHMKLFTPESWERLSAALENTRETGLPYELELETVRKNGGNGWMWVRGERVTDSEGSTIGLWGAAQDITERKRTELALKESEERFKALHNASFGGIAIHEKGLILECNKGLSDITGYEYNELIGMDGLSLISEDTRDKVIQSINTGYEMPYEAEGVRKNGELYPLRLEGRNIPYKGKDVRVVEFRDITESKRADEERVNLEGQLRQAQKMEAVGRLAGGVAHDFNNMLSVIIGHADMALEEVDPNQPLYADLEEIRKAGLRSADLTRQLLAFARKQTVVPKVLDLNKTVGGMIGMLQRLIGEDINLVWLPGDKVWSVKMDPSQVDQVLANLCVNARDAIADVGKVTIETGNAVFDQTYCTDHVGFSPGEYALLAVSDNGCGMDSETLGNVFEPFFTTKEPGKGTGLGLATVYGVVKQNNGFLNVYSEPGHGTTFRIYLPQHMTMAGHLPKKGAGQKAERGHETILLVEDEPAILRMTTMMLERLGYTVVPARTPGEAISLAQEHAGEIHMIVTDVVMPEMNGRDLAKNILSSYPNLKRLFMSGYTANVIAHHGVLDEGVNFIQKPFSRESLGVKVREALDEGRVKKQ
ncbi:MAG: PAS domain S-box protein [Desulfobacterales bacterium]|nr:PAS domain S-box protein [Desulfobacterales bacterium]